MPGLRDQAERDLGSILEAPGDWGVPLVLTDPANFTGTKQLYGRTGDVGMYLDPDTGVTVTGRYATATVRLSTLTANGFTSVPRAIADATSKPWRVTYDGLVRKVKASQPDYTAGVVMMILESYEA